MAKLYTRMVREHNDALCSSSQTGFLLRFLVRFFFFFLSFFLFVHYPPFPSCLFLSFSSFSADASLEEIRQQVLAERRDWVQSRGLIGGNCTFSVFLTPELRAHYDTEYGALLNRHITQWGQLDRGGAIGGGARGGAGVGVEMKGVGLHTYVYISLL